VFVTPVGVGIGVVVVQSLVPAHHLHPFQQLPPIQVFAAQAQFEIHGIGVEVGMTTPLQNTQQSTPVLQLLAQLQSAALHPDPKHICSKLHLHKPTPSQAGDTPQHTANTPSA